MYFHIDIFAHRFGSNLVMFGVRLNTVNVSGSLYLNVIVQGVMNALCLVSMWTVDIPLLGRRGNIVGFMMLTGLSLLAMVLVPECKFSIFVQLILSKGAIIFYREGGHLYVGAGGP